MIFKGGYAAAAYAASTIFLETFKSRYNEINSSGLSFKSGDAASAFSKSTNDLCQ